MNFSLRAWCLCVRVVFVALLATLVRAETSQEAGNRLIRQCLEAVGGQAYLSMRDKVQHGRAYQFYQERLSGLAIMTVYTKYDPKPSSPEPGWIGLNERRDIGKNVDYSILFTEGKGYEITYRGARPFTDVYMKQYRDRVRRDIFYILKYRLDEPGMIFEWLGTEIIDNQTTDAVRITDADNLTVTVYLAKSSHLPNRQEYNRRDPATRDVIHEVGNYSKYRAVSGVQLPWFTQLVRNDEKIFEMFGDSLEINKRLDDTVFALKKGTKVLPIEKQ